MTYIKDVIAAVDNLNPVPEKFNVYRGTSGIAPKSIKPKFDGDGHFGRGTYFAITEENARSYMDSDNPPTVLTEYSVMLKAPLILINRDDQKSALFNTAKALDLKQLGLAEKFKAKKLERTEDLGQAALKAGYDGIVMKGMIEGGDQLLLPLGSKAKVKQLSQDVYEGSEED